VEAGADVLFDVLFVGVAVLALWVGAEQFVTGASQAARRLGVPGLVIGLTVVAFGTSAPEFAVTLDAALSGRPDVSVANVVGSNVLNLGFILGGTALVRSLPIGRDLVRRDATLLVGTTLLLLVVVRDLQLSRGDGLVLFGVLVVYLVVLARAGSTGGGDDLPAARTFAPLDLGRLVGGLALVVGGAHLLVTSAVDIALAVGISEWVIGVTVVAAGTSIPEFATSVAAVRQGRVGISAGNIVGSCVFNTLGVLGLAAAVQPLPVAGAAVETTLWLLGVTVLVTVFFYTSDVLSRVEGAVLVALNAVNWVLDLVVYG
jgi:cation:H+ antiporter